MMSFEIHLFMGKNGYASKFFIVSCLSFLLSFSLRSQIVINEIFPDGTVELKNVGSTTIDVSSYWLCDFPAYEMVDSSNLICESGSTIMEPGDIIAVDDFNFIDPADGELGLYSSRSFASAEAIVDYVQWGSGSHGRASVAVAAGILSSEDSFVPAFSMMQSLAYDGIGDSPSDWFVLTIPTICEENGLCGVAGGEISGGPFSFCVGDGIDDNVSNVGLAENIGAGSQWVVTDDQGIILGLPPTPDAVNFDGAGTGLCLIWHLSFDGELSGLEVGQSVDNLDGCFAFSNAIEVNRLALEGGTITTADGLTELSICAGDGLSDAFNVALTGNSGPNSAWVITDPELNILDLPNGPPFDLEGAGEGTCLIWHISFDDGLVGAEVGANVDGLQGCFDLSNAISVSRTGVDGGSIEALGGVTELEICAGDGVSDAFEVALDGNTGPNSAWVITDPDLNILDLPLSPPFDLEGAGEGTCLIWHLSFDDGLVGVERGANVGDLEGCFDLSNAIAIERTGVNGGELATADGTTELEICAGDGASDAFEVVLAGNVGSSSAWVITDQELNILGLPTGPPFDLEGAGEGVCLVWHLSYDGSLRGVEIGANAGDLQGCFDLSNAITVVRTGVDGGELTTADGATDLEICAGDGTSDAFEVSLAGNVGPNSAWVITDTELNILGLPAAPPFDLEGAGEGTCLIWHVSFADGLTGVEMGANAGDLEGCFDLSNAITVIRNVGAACEDDCSVVGGELTTADGATDLEICAGDGTSDAFEVSLEGNVGPNSAWVITDTELNILGLPAAPPFDLEGAGEGTCLIWHVSFADSLTGVEMGANAGDLEGCFDLSNAITVIRTGVDGGELTTTDGATELEICAGDGTSDAFDVSLAGNVGPNSAWVITDTELNILGLPAAPPFDLEGAGEGTCLIWHVSFADGLTGVEMGANAGDLEGCFDLSNAITVIRNTGTACEGGQSEGVDVELSISGPSEFTAFETFPYELSITNTGTETANNIVVKADPPEGTAYVEHIESKGNYGSFFKRWEIPSLEPGESATLEISVFPILEGEAITGFVEVIEMDEEDTDSSPGNGNAPIPVEDDEAAILIQPDTILPMGGESADLELSITTEKENYTIFEDFTYQVNLVNNGPDAAANVVVALPFPEGMVFSGSASTLGRYGTFFQQWEIPLIESGETATLNLTLYPLVENTTLTFYGQVTASDQDDPDSNPGNGEAPEVNEDDEAVTRNDSGVSDDFVINPGNIQSALKSTTRVYPNPAFDRITLEIITEIEHSTVIRIVNLNGNMVHEMYTDLVNGINQLEIETQLLSNGKYYITFNDKAIPLVIQNK